MNFEFAILDFIRNNLTSPFMDTLMKAITFLGNGGWIWIAFGVILSFIPKTRKIGFTVCLGLIFSLLLCNLTLKPLVARVRPYEIKEIVLIIAKPHDYSFPSGHSSASFAGAVAIFLNNKKWGIAAIILASFIALSRLYLYVHFPTDVLCGALLGSLCAVIGYLLLKAIYKLKKA